MESGKFPVPKELLDIDHEPPISIESGLRILESIKCKPLSEEARMIKQSGLEPTLETLKTGLETIKSALDYGGEAAQSSIARFV